MTASSRVEPLRVGARAFGAAGVGRHHRQVRRVEPRQVIDDHRRREQVVDRDVKEPLDLRLVQIHRQHAIRAGRAQHVRHQLRRNRHARLVLPILPRVAVIRHHRRDARRRRAAERVDHDQQLDEVLVDRPGRVRAGRLHDEHVGAADVLVDLKRDFRVGKPPQPRLPEPARRETSAISRASSGCALPENSFSSPNPVAINGSPIHLTSLARNWLGRKDSNLRIRDPKSRALPLGHAPTLSHCGYQVAACRPDRDRSP